MVYEEITQGVPRHIVEMSLLKPKTKEVYSAWHRDTVPEYYTSLKAEFLKVTKEDQESFLSFLDNIIEGQDQQLGLPAVSWYDQGLFYFDDVGNVHVLNPMARQALDSLWRQFRLREVIGDPGQTGSADGAIFEREVRRGFFKCQTQIELLPYYLKANNNDTENKEPAKPLIISTIARMIPFTKDTELPTPRPRCCILQPTSQTYSGLDFIIEDSANKQIVFVQTTKMLPHSHEDSKLLFQKLFSRQTKKDDKGTTTELPCKIERLLQSLLNVKTEATIDNKSSHFIIILPESVSDWQVKFLYITSQHDAIVKQQCFWKWKDVVVAGRETIRPLNLLFYESN